MKNLIVLIALSLVLVFSGDVYAGSIKAKDQNAEVSEFIENIALKTIKIVQDKQSSEANKKSALEELFKKTVDVKWIGEFVAGRSLKDAAAEKKDEYLKYYQDFLVNSYVPKFRNYTDQEILVKKVSKEDEGKFVVDTQIVSKSDSSKNINVSYKVKSEAKKQYKIVDVVAEGVSLITTQRSEFSSVISREGFDNFVKKLKSRSESLANQSSKNVSTVKN